MSAIFDLNTVWFLLVGILLTGYAILDGFDLGVGALHLFTKEDSHRRIMLNAIGPVWDGNEVWLVTGGGALFAAFPEAYATSFSGFYLAFIFLLFALIFRAVAIEFRSKQPMLWWRKLWDISFSVSSIISALLIGIALGNLVWGIPLDSEYEYAGTFLGLLHPYALVLGVTVLALFMMHGAIYMLMKSEGDLHDIIRGWIMKLILFFVVCYLFLTVLTLWLVPHMTDLLMAYPVLFIFAGLSFLAIVNIPREVHRGRDFRAFLSSSAAIAGLMTLFGLGMYPHLIISNPVVENSLNIYNAASSQTTLFIMLIIALIGMPLVLSYTISIYWIFRGKVKLGPMSY